MRYLTKSRYKTGLECPNKLFFTKKKEYANTKQDDSFLEALASGGFQVEELARMHYPDGVLIDDIPGEKYNYDEKVIETNELLQRENVTIFEAAFKFENLFIRCDIINKRGNVIELIEVKAKSYDPDDENFFLTKRGKVNRDWKFYMYDVAFQKYVIERAFPQYKVQPYLMLADKSKTTTIEGLNQMFRISKSADNRTGIIKGIEKLNDIEKESVLTKVDVQDLVANIEEGKTKIIDELEFEESINYFSEIYYNDTYANWPVSFGVCKHCEFQNTPETAAAGLKSGLEYCFKKQINWKDEDFEKPNIFEIWDFRRWPLMNEKGKIFLDEMDDEDFGEIKPKGDTMPRVERQLIQREKSLSGDKTPYLLKDELKAEMDSWVYPLNMIDFETSNAALPYHAGMRPYEQVAFQFSHHIMHQDGRVEHANEYVNVNPGEFPNFLFIRALKKALEQNDGSVFMFAPHENTILNAIYRQLILSHEPDKEQLIEFIKSIAKPVKDSAEKWIAKRPLIDLCQVIKDYYYNPYTNGSNSIKAVLPAVFESSQYVRGKYSQSLKEINVSSMNFDNDMVWLEEKEGKVVDPYKKLGKVFPEWDEDYEIVSEIKDLNNGGVALAAYGKCQYTSMSDEERELIRKALLRYCELDTLAMVMVVEHLKEITE